MIVIPLHPLTTKSNKILPNRRITTTHSMEVWRIRNIERISARSDQRNTLGIGSIKKGSSIQYNTHSKNLISQKMDWPWRLWSRLVAVTAPPSANAVPARTAGERVVLVIVSVASPALLVGSGCSSGEGCGTCSGHSGSYGSADCSTGTTNDPTTSPMSMSLPSMA